MLNFGEYEEVKEPNKKEKYENWRIAIGLQATDNLEVSDFLKDLADKNIAGKMTSSEVIDAVLSYYNQNEEDKADEQRKKEADLVAARINDLLSDPSFSLSPAEFIHIHKFLFEGIKVNGKDIAGVIREKTIRKKEWILNYESINYGYAPVILETLEYEFFQEKQFDYSKLTPQEKVVHIIKFIASIWQVHPFYEGNTRTTAVYFIRYLRSQGYIIDNDYFEKNSWYFRNALVRAHYQNAALDINPTYEYLNKFFSNALFETSFSLKNRDLHISIHDTANASNDTVNNTVNAVNDTVKGENDTVNDMIFNLIRQTPTITASDIKQKLGVSLSTVKRNIKKLKDSGKITRIGSDKAGHWMINN